MGVLAGKAVLVTGGASGIGRASALECAAAGARVLIADVQDAAAAIATARERGYDIRFHRTDVSVATEVAALLRHALGELGGLDVLINAAGIGGGTAMTAEYSEEEFDRVVAVNLRGNFHVLTAAGRLMTAQGSGSIVLFSSIRALVTEPGQSVYGMTKAGIVQLARSAATEWATSGVRVNAVAPGVTETPLTAPIKANADWYAAYATKPPINRWARAEEMAGPAVFLLSDAASYVTGTVLYVDGGWTAADGRFTPPGM